MMENSGTSMDYGFEEVEIKPEFFEADEYLVSFFLELSVSMSIILIY